MIKDYAMFAISSFRARKLRTLLTILGIIIGIAAVVSLVSLGQGLEETINEQFRALGGDKIIVTGSGGLLGFTGGAATNPITEDDLDVVLKTKGVKNAAPMLMKLGQVKFGDETKTTFVSGIPTDSEQSKILNEIQTFTIEEGRNLKEGDGNVAIVGILLWEGNFYDKKVNVRNKLYINGHELKVVGILGRIGNPSDDSQILIPLDTAREIFDEPNKVDTIMLQARPGLSPSDVAKNVEKDLRKHRNVDEGEEDFNVATFEQILETFGDILIVVQAILIGIAAISLLVGGIGIMNTMFTAVLQRTQEIGVLKAIGARNSDIVFIFLIESGFLGFVGGLIGIAIGWGMGQIVEIAAVQYGLPFEPFFSTFLIVGSLSFSFGVGAIAGIAPAISASRLKPVEALRYE